MNTSPLIILGIAPKLAAFKARQGGASLAGTGFSLEILFLSVDIGPFAFRRRSPAVPLKLRPRRIPFLARESKHAKI